MAVMVQHSPETFSAILTLEDPHQRGVGGIALLTLSDTEDSLHFLLLFRGLLGGEC